MNASDNNLPHGTFIEYPDNDARSSPFVLFQLFPDDTGDYRDRMQRKEYSNREPYCVQWLDDTLLLRIANLGRVACDLAKVEYEFRFCTISRHKPGDGFQNTHTEQAEGSQFSMDLLPPMQGSAPGRLEMVIPIPRTEEKVANIYFRARVSTLWTRPNLSWDFAADRTVVEATRIIGP